jgi:hypothetical protein
MGLRGRRKQVTGENFANRSFVICTNLILFGSSIKKNWMGTYGGDKRCVQYFGGQT